MLFYYSSGYIQSCNISLYAIHILLVSYLGTCDSHDKIRFQFLAIQSRINFQIKMILTTKLNID